MTKARDIASAAPAPAGVTSTELGYVDGVTSALQTQIDGKIAKTLTTTTGDIIYASSANTPARLGIGSTDQVLKVSGGVPAWATPAAATSGLNLISRTSFSAVAGQNFDNVFTSTYKAYRVVVETISSSTATDTLEFQTRVGGTTRTASYYGALGKAIFNSASYDGTLTTNNASSLRIGTANLGPTLTTLSFDIYQVGQNARFNLSGTGVTGETGIVTFFGGYRGATEVVDGFRLFGPSGNITGTVAIYGYGV
jgi:hypothetical protein